MTQTVNEKTAWRVFAGISMVAFTAAVSAHAYVGWFGRMMTDDYCTAGILKSHGFFGAQKYWFLNWTGRFAFTVAIDSAHVIGPKIASFLPAIVLISLLFALTQAILPLMSTAIQHRITLSVLLAEIIVVSTLATIPSIYQSFYWQTGVITYIFPLIFGTAYVALLGRMARASRPPGPGLLFIGGCLTFIAAGFSETFAALQGAALGLALLLSLRTKPGTLLGRHSLAFIFVGLIGATAGAALVLFAPGNAPRIAEEVATGLATSPPDHAWITVVKHSAHFALDSIVMACRSLQFIIPALFLPAALAFTAPGERQKQSSMQNAVARLSKRLIPSAIVAVILIVSSFVPSGYVSAYMRGNYYPPDRVFVIPQYVFYCFVCTQSYFAGMSLRQVNASAMPLTVRGPKHLVWLFAVLSLISVAVAASSVRRTWFAESTVRTFATVWDQQEGEIGAAKIAGQRTVHVGLLPATSEDPRGRRLYGLRLIGPVADDWVNECMADYHGLDSIVSE